MPLSLKRPKLFRSSETIAWYNLLRVLIRSSINLSLAVSSMVRTLVIPCQASSDSPDSLGIKVKDHCTWTNICLAAVIAKPANVSKGYSDTRDQIIETGSLLNSVREIHDWQRIAWCFKVKRAGAKIVIHRVGRHCFIIKAEHYGLIIPRR